MIFHFAVPVQTQPAKRVQDLLHILFLRALQVRVLDAQQEPTAVTAGKQPVEQSRARTADVKEARRTGRETHPYFRIAHLSPRVTRIARG
ncbi:MAG: hypothetical protein Kow0059_21390 [Candidatus Sumerlaeia bacterium]